MKFRCLFGHTWREMEKFKSRAGYRDNRTNPEKICMRCFKMWRRRVAFYIESAEGPGFGYYGPPYYQGQRPPEGYSSWKEYWDSGVKRLLSKDSVVGKSRFELGAGRPKPRRITPNMREQMNRRK